jgi:Uma2 family endonuclease
MSQTTTDRVRWTTTDIDLLASSDYKRYEIIDGELFVTRALHWTHQETCGNICVELERWSKVKGLG